MPFAYVMLALFCFSRGDRWLGWTLLVLAGLSAVAHARLPARVKPSKVVAGALFLTALIGLGVVWYGLHFQVLGVWLGGLALIVGVDGVVNVQSWRSWQGHSTSMSLRAG
ncbi:MAG: hypothetical protein ACHQO8_07390 [Vicinamibacterales bacterium]